MELTCLPRLRRKSSDVVVGANGKHFSAGINSLQEIRPYLIRPEFARKGIGRRILTMCETEAKGYCFHSIELMATLPGVPFYNSCGYYEICALELDMGRNVKLDLVRMSKEIQ